LDEKLSAKELLGLTSLAGVGVAFKLAHALLEHYNKSAFAHDILPYVTVGTVADVVPLVGENRYYVTKGLEIISAGKHYGLKKLLESAGYTLEHGITSEQIAFGVAPRINASGRLDTTDEALKVLVSDNPQEISMAIISLNNFNKVRQELCESIFLEADDMVQKQGNKDNAIVLFKPDWHIGIVGIVASKLVEKYYKPTFLMTYSEETKQVRCSSRGVEGLNIYDILDANSELFDGFGGHAMAGGLSFSTDKVTFEEVKKAIIKTTDEMLQGRELLPILNVDLKIEPSEVDGNLISDIDRLQPFGAANPNPVFAMYNLTLLQKKLIGANKNHLKLVIEDSQHNTYDCLWWSKGDISLVSGDVLDIAFCPQTNTYNGSTTIQLIVQDIHADNLVEEEIKAPVLGQKKTFDHRKKKDIFATVDDYVRGSNLKIAVFAEDKNVIESLKPYKVLSERIFSRVNLQKVDAVMFFDYPASEEIFEDVLNNTQASVIHFMNYEPKKVDEKEFLKTISGMLKFAFNNKNGVFDLERSAAFLAQTKDAVIELLNVFADCGVAKFSEKGTKEYKIEHFEGVELSKALHSTYYKNFVEELIATQDYKSSLLESEINIF